MLRLRSAQVLDSITADLIPRSLLPKELFPDLLESVIPECSIGNPGETGTGPPIKTFGGDAFGINSHRYVLIPRQLAAGMMRAVDSSRASFP